MIYSKITNMKPLSQKKIIQLFEKEVSALFPQLSIKQVNETPIDFRTKINIENNTYLFIILVCKRPYPSEIGSLLKRVKTEEGNFLLLGTYFPPGTQSYLEKEGINFLDLSGNCSINVLQHNTNKKHEVHMRISGKQNLYPFAEILKNVFTGKSSRIVRTLLELFPQKFKPLQLAKMCRVSPALVTRVIEALEEESFISRENGIFIVDPGLLLDQWADNYQFKKNSLEHSYYFNKPLSDILKPLFLKTDDFVLTRTIAASLIAPFANIKVIEAYKKKEADFADLLVDQSDVQFLPSRKGANVIIYSPYDEGVLDYTQKVDGYNTVGLIQLYLDLYSDPKRGKEQAAFLRERKLKF